MANTARSGIGLPSLFQRIIHYLAGCWLLLMPAADIVLFTLFSPHINRLGGGISWLSYCFGLLANLAFWAGFFLTLHKVILASRAAKWPVLQFTFRALLRLLLVTGHLYFLFIWAFTVGNGHPPNPTAIIFLIDNAARVPQHIIQTAPLVAAAVLCLSLLGAILIERALGAFSASLFADKKGRVEFAAIVFLATWYLATPLGSGFSPISLVFAGSAEEKIEERTRLLLSSLKPLQRNVIAAAPQHKYPVIVILVESLRYDLLTEHPEAVPFLKSLRDNYMGFDRSYATASHSNLTDLAFWYSQYPLRGERKESYPVAARWRGTSLFRVFKDSGYPTAYISSQNEHWGDMANWLKTADVDFFFDSESYGGETWENYDDANGLGGMLKRGLVTAGKVEDTQTLKVAKQWIAQRSDKSGFFLGMNLQNTHFSYVMPPNGIEPYQPSDLGFKAVYYSWPENQKKNVRNRYLNAVANVDKMLEQFVDELKRQGLWDECLFVVVGDNGEGFYEHGFGNHSGPMYDEAVRTLTVIKPPRSVQSQPSRITYPVSHIDIAATVPRLAGLNVPQSFQGQPIESSDAPQRPVYMYSNAIVKQFGIVSWPWKLLITQFPEDKEQLYRLDSDPGELSDLSATDLIEKARLAKSLKLWISVQTAYYATAAYESKIPPQYLDVPPAM